MKKLEDWNDLGIARVHLDLTQLQMAEAIGVGLRTYQNWERHISKPTEFVQIEVIAKINQMLSK
jgi:DNA-binding XRE family transcriptional regulator